jgi:hypothetical protein
MQDCSLVQVPEYPYVIVVWRRLRIPTSTADSVETTFQRNVYVVPAVRLVYFVKVAAVPLSSDNFLCSSNPAAIVLRVSTSLDWSVRLRMWNSRLRPRELLVRLEITHSQRCPSYDLAVQY